MYKSTQISLRNETLMRGCFRADTKWGVIVANHHLSQRCHLSWRICVCVCLCVSMHVFLFVNVCACVNLCVTDCKCRPWLVGFPLIETRVSIMKGELRKFLPS